MAETTILRYLADAKKTKTVMKVFLESGGGQQKTMLKGIITDFDDDALVLDECLVPMERVISIAPDESVGNTAPRKSPRF